MFHWAFQFTGYFDEYSTLGSHAANGYNTRTGNIIDALSSRRLSRPPEDFPRVVNVWEASVRATHHFVTEADIQFFKPLVREGLPHVAELACVRDGEGEVIGFIGIVDAKVEMLFIHPALARPGDRAPLADTRRNCSRCDDA